MWWDAPDETETGAQWITAFRIYGSASEGCGGYMLDEYEVEHPGFTTPPEHPDGTPTGFKYFKIVYVGPVKFGVASGGEEGPGGIARPRGPRPQEGQQESPHTWMKLGEAAPALRQAERRPPPELRDGLTA